MPMLCYAPENCMLAVIQQMELESWYGSEENNANKPKVDYILPTLITVIPRQAVDGLTGDSFCMIPELMMSDSFYQIIT